MSQTPETPAAPEPEPTRPSWKWLVIIVAGIAVITSIMHWDEVSEFANLQEIGQALGIG